MKNSKIENPKKRALVTGITGQDGSYLCDLLLSKDYEVFGLIRRAPFEIKDKYRNIHHLIDRVHLLPCSLENQLGLYKIIAEVQPQECYHLAASSFVSYDFDNEASLISTNFNSTHFLLSCIRELTPKCKFYYAGSSELFGDAVESPQTEKTPFNPRSIYGISKLGSYHVVKNYRDHHGIFACTGIAYNHESPRRGFEYVTRKISSGVAKIHLGLSDSVELGNLETQRDWGYAPEFVEAMWKMLNAETPEDYVIAGGVSRSLRALLEAAFSAVNLDYQKYIRINKKFFRPSEKVPLVGDSSKIKKDLNWSPKKDFKEMISEMVASDISALQK